MKTFYKYVVKYIMYNSGEYKYSSKNLNYDSLLLDLLMIKKKNSVIPVIK